MGAAMLGGAVYAGRASQRAQYREQDQEARLEQLEQQPGSAPAPAPAPAAATPAPATAAPASSGLAAQIQQLADLKDSGVLSAEEFEAAKQKLLAG
jgi:hypothetical protein